MALLETEAGSLPYGGSLKRRWVRRDIDWTDKIQVGAYKAKWRRTNQKRLGIVKRRNKKRNIDWTDLVQVRRYKAAWMRKSRAAQPRPMPLPRPMAFIQSYGGLFA